MVKRNCSLAIAAMILMASGGSALAEGDLFIRNLTLTPEQVARHAPRPADPFTLEQTLAEAVLRESNIRRAEAGLGALTPDASLAQSARRYSQKMRDLAFFSHDAPDGEGLSRRLPESERYRYSQLGENLWSGKGALDWRESSLSRQATQDWILSPSHRDNLLEPVYDVAGVGVAVASDQVFITMLYAKPQIDAASARLRSLYPAAPTDLANFATTLESETLTALNSARAGSALPGLTQDFTLSQEARQHAQSALAGIGAVDSQATLNRILDNRANQSSRLTILMWQASGGLTWQGQALADSALASWQGDGASLTDILNSAHDRAGIGAATDGSRVFVSVVLSDTRDPAAPRIISGTEPVSLLNDGSVSTLSGGSYISLD